jgi:hypothetical protein
VQAGNPLPRRRATPRIVRYLSRELWLEIKTFIRGMPTQADPERKHHAPVRWLFTLLRLGGVHVTESGTNTMRRFFRRANENGKNPWWLGVMAKGGRKRLVPATTEMMTERGTCRRPSGLPALPSPGKHTPLVLLIGHSVKPLTRAARTGS